MRLDPSGDPLPEYALARLGSLRFRHPHEINSAALSPDGKLCAVHSTDEVRLFDAGNGKPIRTFAIPQCESRPLFTADGKTLVTIARDEQTFEQLIRDNNPTRFVKIWDVATGKAIRSIATGNEEIERFLASGDGRILAVQTRAAKEVKIVMLFEIATGKRLAQLPLLHDWVKGLGLSEDGKRLVTWGQCSRTKKLEDKERETRDQSIQVWDTVAGKEWKRLRIDGLLDIKNVTLSADGKTLAVSDHREPIRLWDVEAGKERQQLLGRAGLGVRLLFSSDSNSLVASTLGGTVQRWEVATGDRLGVYEGLGLEGEDLVLTKTGRLFAWYSGARHRHIFHLKDVVADRRHTPLDGHQGAILAAHCNGRGEAVSFSADGVLCRWHLAEGKLLRRQLLHYETAPLQPGRHEFRAAVFAPDGKHLLATSDDDRAILVDVASGQELCVYPWRGGGSHRADGFPVAFAPDSQRFAVAEVGEKNEPQRVWLHSVRSGKAEESWQVPGSRVTGLAFAAGGKGLLTVNVSFEGETKEQVSLRMWDATTGKELWRHKTGQVPVAVARDGRTLALAVDQGAPAVMLSDATTGKERLRIKLPQEQLVTQLVFSPDGQLLATASYNHKERTTQVLIWDTATGKLRLGLPAQAGEVHALTFAPDGTRLVSGGSDTTLLVWDLSGLTELKTKPQH